MRTVQPGDRVRVQYVKRFEDGSVASCRAPLELTVGVRHPRLPGLGQALVGLAVGTGVTVSVPAGIASRPHDPERIRRWRRTRFPEGQALPVGKWIRVSDRRGRSRLVRIVEGNADSVLVDTNPRCVGQGLKIDVQVLLILDSAIPADGQQI
jgi:peptidyl-prolyl cis-trans isomerase B (cyclophilin B)